MNAIIELKDIKRDFLVGNETVHALRGVPLLFSRENS